MPRFNWFEMPVDNPERAIGFYKRVFNWKVKKFKGEGDYWVVTTGKPPERGINGGLARRSAISVTTNSVIVRSVDRFVKEVVAAGGKVVEPRMDIPGMGFLAYCKDTEGNVFGIIQPRMEKKARKAKA